MANQMLTRGVARLQMNVATALAPLGQPGHATLATCEGDIDTLSVTDVH